MIRHSHFRATALAVAFALTAPSWAWAAPNKPPPTPEQMNEARRRYDRALELSDEGNYDDALIELQRAYELAPTYRLLYNLGVVSVAVHDYVKALDYYDRYLKEGGTDIDAARVEEVEKQMERLRPRIARITVTVSVPGADVRLDDVDIGHAPLSTEIPVNAGRHKVSASAPGYLPSDAFVELAGTESRRVNLQLIEAAVAGPQKPSKPFPWLGWGITAALGAGAAVTGVLSLSAASKYDNDVGTLGVSGDQVSSDYRKMRNFSYVTDGLLVATVIAAGVSLYFTIKPAKAQSKERATVHIRPDGFVF